MISFLNYKRDEEGATVDSLAAAAKRRLRPILLTTITTAAGLIPTAYGFAGDNPFIVPMVMAIVWGLLLATFITLVFLPSLYMLQISFNSKVSKACSTGYHKTCFWKK